MLKKIYSKYSMVPLGVKASIWFLLCSFLQKGISVITTPIFTRILSTSEYGKYNVFNSWMSIVSVFVTLNLAHGVYMQGLVKFEHERNIFSSVIQGLNLTLISGWTIIYIVFRDFWNQLFSLTTVQMLLMLVMIWTSSVFQFWSTEQRVDLKYKTLVAVTLMSALCKPLLSIFFILHMEDKVTARILGLAVVELAFFSWMFFSQLIKGKKIYSKKYWRYAIGFCVPLIPHYLSQTVLSGADRIMIEKLVDTSSAGIYGLAYSLSQLMTIFNTALLSTINPWIYKKIKEKNIKEVVSLSYLVCIIIAFVNILLIAIAPEAVRVFAPSSYIDAIWIIPSVAMSVYFQFQYSIFSDFEFYYEKTSFIASATILSAGLNILLNFIFIRQFGYVAAGYTTLVCYIAYTCFHYATSKYIIKKEIQSSDTFDTRILLLISIIFVGVGFGLQITYSYTPIRYTILIIIFAVIFIKRKTIISVIKNEIMSKRNAD